MRLTLEPWPHLSIFIGSYLFICHIQGFGKYRRSGSLTQATGNILWIYKNPKKPHSFMAIHALSSKPMNLFVEVDATKQLVSK